MPVIKCKMCGGDLNIVDGSTVCECEYCGTKQTVPKVDDEKKLKLFSRAGNLLRSCEFDKASGVFESIVADFPEEAEAYWGLILCKYGIEYVDDPATGKKVPTCHRSSFESVEDDSNYEQACENADAVARRVYREEARQIETLRKRILEVSGKEEPYDVFISYKELDEDGDRTPDSVIAQDIYRALTKEGYRVFFSRISLEGKLGVEYEPYIFAALNSAKVMIVVGTDYEYFDAVWVKNEWSRFLKLIASGQQKTVIPVYKDMDPYDMPKEMRALAAQNMGKIGAMQDLLHGVEKLLGKTNEQAQKEQPVIVQSGGPNVAALLDRGFLSLEDSDWSKAQELFDQVLNIDPRNADAYLGLAMAEEKCRDKEAFHKAYIDPASKCKSNKRLARAKQFGDIELQKWFEQLGTEAREAREKARAKAEADRIAKKKAEQEAAEKAERVRIEKERADREAAQKEQERIQFKFNQVRKCQSFIAAGSNHTVGLRSDGTVISTRYTGFKRNYHGQCDVSDWTDIISVAVGQDHTVGLKKDGTVIATKYIGNQGNYHGECNVDSWKSIVAIAASAYHTIGLKSDGTVMAVGANGYGECRVSNWVNIVAIASGKNHTVGLRSDGTVVAVGKNSECQCNVTKWKDIVAIAAGEYHTVGLRDDGTVLTTNYFSSDDYDSQYNYGQWDVSSWSDIVAISAGAMHTIGLKIDGTVVSTDYHERNGNEHRGQCDVSSWTNMVAVSAGNSHTAGIKADGSVMVTEYSGDQNYYFGECDIYSWKLFNYYDKIQEEQATAIQNKVEVRISRYLKERENLQYELSNLHGLFTGKRRREIEARLAEIEEELKKLK